MSSVYGARNELRACVELMNEGYEVFRNVAPTGIDLIVWDHVKSRAFRVEVKSALTKMYDTKSRGLCESAHSPAQRPFVDWDILCGWDAHGEWIMIFAEDFDMWVSSYPRDVSVECPVT